MFFNFDLSNFPNETHPDFSKNPSYNETYYITGSGTRTAEMMELYFKLYIKPYMKFMKDNGLIILTKANSCKLIKTN